MRSDWVVGLVAVVFVAGTFAISRWKYGHRRRFRVTVVIERDYEGPDGELAPRHQAGGMPGQGASDQGEP